jgi:hypothetical protein
MFEIYSNRLMLRHAWLSLWNKRKTRVVVIVSFVSQCTDMWLETAASWGLRATFETNFFFVFLIYQIMNLCLSLDKSHHKKVAEEEYFHFQSSQWLVSVDQINQTICYLNLAFEDQLNFDSCHANVLLENQIMFVLEIGNNGTL